jgi:purine-binding chemotaxis protein CheW
LNEEAEIDDEIQELHLVVFRLGSEEFAVDINSIREIIRFPNITNVPNTPDYVLGVINLRGQITTVMNLRKRFRMEDTDMTDDTRILIVNMGTEHIGLMVDGVSEVLKVDSGKLVSDDEIGSSTYGQYISGMIKVEERLVILLDLIKAFKNQ